MNEEIAKILTMVQEKQITTKKGVELIAQLKNDQRVNNQTPTSYSKKLMKIQINSADGDKINIQLPIKLVKSILQAGRHIAESLPEYKKYVKDVDMDLLLTAIEHETEGEIVDITTASQDTILIVIEL